MTPLSSAIEQAPDEPSAVEPGEGNPAATETSSDEEGERAIITENPGAVIPPGREELLAKILGRGETLPGGCKLSAATIEYDHVDATYDCAGGQVVLELGHPDKAAPNAVATDDFALALRSGSAPEGLTDALLARMRQHEAEFAWHWPEATSQEAGSGPPGALIVVALFLGAVLLGYLWRRR